MLTSIRIRSIKVASQQSIQNDGDGYGSETESPDNPPVSLRCADDRVEDCADKKPHNETTDMRYPTFFVSVPYCIRESCPDQNCPHLWKISL
jgi:hypothetical protein